MLGKEKKIKVSRVLEKGGNVNWLIEEVVKDIEGNICRRILESFDVRK